MRIPSHIDLAYHAIIMITALLIGVAGFWVPAQEAWLVWIPGLAVVGVLGWIIYGTWYAFEATHLVCHSGPFVERIAYTQIRSIKTCANYFSSMATAHQRLEIRQHDKSFVMGTTYISPRDQDRFLAELAARCPNLVNN